MSQIEVDTYAVRIDDFINDVMMPSESLARVFLQAGFEVDINKQTQAELEDIGTVYAALNAYTKLRLHGALSKLSEKTGEISVLRQRNVGIHAAETIDVTVQGKTDPACRQ